MEKELTRRKNRLFWLKKKGNLFKQTQHIEGEQELELVIEEINKGLKKIKKKCT